MGLHRRQRSDPGRPAWRSGGTSRLRAGAMLDGRRGAGGAEFRLQYPGHRQVPRRRGPLSLSLPLGITNLNPLALIRGCISSLSLAYCSAVEVEFQLHPLFDGTWKKDGSRDNGRGNFMNWQTGCRCTGNQPCLPPEESGQEHGGVPPTPPFRRRRCALGRNSEHSTQLPGLLPCVGVSPYAPLQDNTSKNLGKQFCVHFITSEVLSSSIPCQHQARTSKTKPGVILEVGDIPTSPGFAVHRFLC